MEPHMPSALQTWCERQLESIPWARWGGLGFVAVAGSLLYGASLALVLPGWKLTAAALWLALSAGLAWVILIPVLCRVGHIGFVPCCDACLVTMAVGEGVLMLGALLNGLLWQSGGSTNAAVINGLVVGVSNVVMANVLAGRLRQQGVSRSRTWVVWMVALDGSGAIFFAIFYRWLHP